LRGVFRSSASEPAWVKTDRSRAQARFVAFTRYPHLMIRRLWQRRRGVRAPAGVPVTVDEVLARLEALPLSVWTYGWDHDSVRHMGPMSQDFAKAFGLGSNDRAIDLVDANGVLMAACQALSRRVADLEAQLAGLRAQIDELKPSGK
jgi:hypothetical protein